jgi:3-methyladenine DNA glycosylase AlkD
LRRFQNPERARFSEGFFKTRKGEYAAGDRFLGVTVPDTRRIAREFRELPLPELKKLLQSPIHEERLLALIVLNHRFAKADEAERERLFRFYVARRKHVNNWDLVDVSAHVIVGGWLEGRDTRLLDKLARSKSLWDRRIAMVATLHGIRRGHCDDVLRIAEALVADEHDLIHKAVGWMLREMGKRDEIPLREFLNRHARVMPRTMLRYAIEKFPPHERQQYLRGQLSERR